MRCMKTLAIIRIKMVVSVVQSMVTWLSCLEACPVGKRVRSNALHTADLCDRKIEEDKTDSMLRLDFNKILKILIGHENM